MNGPMKMWQNNKIPVRLCERRQLFSKQCLEVYGWNDVYSM